MAPRRKKLIVALSAMPFLILYMGLAVTLREFLPEGRAIDLVYYVTAGVAWAFPLKPVMLWMNQEPS